jgi:hypothetical protein
MFCGRGCKSAPVTRSELPVPHVVVIIELEPALRVHDPAETTRFQRFAGGFAAGLDDRPTLTAHDGTQRGDFETKMPGIVDWFTRHPPERAGER